MSEDLPALTEVASDEPKPRLIVRVRTSCWSDCLGIHIRKDVFYLKRLCSGFNVLSEDCVMVGSDDVVKRITNLIESADGVYQVVTYNERKDWETGHIEDYDYKLIPFNPPQQ